MSEATVSVASRQGMPRILFLSEAATLAHVARPAALFSSVDAQRFDPYFACATRSWPFLAVPPDRLLPIDSLDSRVFADRLRRGKPLYEASTLRDYVAADLALIEQVRPDLVVGDFRISLSVSARAAGVPYACITNAYWSPFVKNRSLPLPVLSWTRHAPLGLTQLGFDLLRPLLLAPHCRPLNTVREEHGMPPLAPDIRSIYTDGDFVLYADAPALFPVPDAPPNHRHVGPVLWSPPLRLPPWWNDLPADLPLVYVTMGSSGRGELLELIVDTVVNMGLGVICATAGAPAPRQQGHVWHAEYLPGGDAADRSRLVICNGGAPTSQQALAAGVPVIGICANMDQLLNMEGLAAAGAGIGLRADRLTQAHLVSAVKTLQARPAGMARDNGPGFQVGFGRFLDDVFGGATVGQSSHSTPAREVGDDRSHPNEPAAHVRSEE